MPQFLRPDQGSSLGRGQRPEVEAAAEADPGVGRFPRPDHHRGADALRRDGRLVQPGEEIGQELRLRIHQAPDQRRDQGRREGTDLKLGDSIFGSKINFPILFYPAFFFSPGRALPRPIHLPPREPVPLPLRAELGQREAARGPRRGRVEGLLRDRGAGDH